MGKKVSAMTELTAGNLNASDYFIVKDTTAGTTKKLLAEGIIDDYITDFSETWLDDANAAAVLTTLGVESFAQDWLDDATLAAFLTTVGLDTSLATLSLPANTTISDIGKVLCAYTGYEDAVSHLSLRTGWTYESKVTCSGAQAIELATWTSDPAEIIVLLNHVDTTNATDGVVIQLEGDTSGYITSGYEGNVMRSYGANMDEQSATSGFALNRPGASSGGTDRTGIAHIHRRTDGGQDWFCEYYGTRDASNTIMSNGFLDFNEDLVGLRLYNLTANFNGGYARVMWRESF